MVALALGVALAVMAVIVGLMLALLGPIITVGVLGALVAVVLAMTNLWVGLLGIVLVITLFPFGTLPFKIVLTPTFLDLAMAAVLAVYVMQWLTGERRRLRTTPVHSFIIVFMVLSLFSFVAGLRHAGITSTSARRFAELLLSMGFSLILVDVLRTPKQIRWLARVLILAGTAAAIIGIVMWMLPDSLAEQILVRLSVFGYPSSGIIQYIEQNPELSERAIGTSVNPNALGGLLVMIAGLAAPQVMTQYPLTGQRWHAYPMLAALVGCLVLTFSRSAMLAFGVAVVFIAAMRYRKVLWAIPLVAMILLVLPWSQAYLQRFTEGFRFIQGAQFTDLATQMRFGEYADAFTLIGRYPLLGAGFTGAPDIDVYLGVASVYLTIAENMGLIGLAAFLGLMTALFVYALRARRVADNTPELRSIWLGAMAALVGALVGGILDHYFFNLEFHHAVTIFWIFVGLALATTQTLLDFGEKDKSYIMRTGTNHTSDNSKERLHGHPN
jgi:O-antigen ligase